MTRHETDPHRRAPRHSRSRRSHGVLRGIALGLVAVVAFGGTAAEATLQRLQSNVTKLDISSLVDNGTVTARATSTDPSDPDSGRAVNILLLGSDDRSGENGEIGGDVAGMRSDTAIVMHVSADRSRIEMVSIPRDSLVKRPACTLSNGKKTAAVKQDMFNNAFAVGWDSGGDMASAAACAWTTVEANTGVHLDHVMVVDFAGFQSMVDAVGGVRVCVEQKMTDSYTGLNLPAGWAELNGVQALEFARARHVSGTDGSDITRITHQQELLSALAHQVLNSNVLTNAPRLLAFASAVTKSLYVDSAFTLSDMTGLAYGLRAVQPANIVFMTIPWQPAPSDPNRVAWTSQATKVWAALAADTSVVSALSTGSTSAAATPSTSATTPAATATSTPLPTGVTSVSSQQQTAAASCG